MAEVKQPDGPVAASSSGLIDESATFQKMQDLLEAKDDTSRFVGLALLKSVLDNGKLSENPAQIKRLWDAMSSKFLDRLLRAQQSQKIKKEDAKDMVDLAVAVLHTFTILLPEEARQDNKLIGRTGPLTKALLSSSPDTTTLILQTLLTFVSQAPGAVELLSIEDISSLVEIADKQPLVLDVLNSMWTNSSTSAAKVDSVKSSMDKTLPTLIVLFRGTDAVTFLMSVGNLLPKLMPEALPSNPKWLKPLVKTMRGLIEKRPTVVGRTAYTQLAAALLQVFPTSPDLLFKEAQISTPDSKPFSYLFINLLLIDIRSSFPSLLSQLNSAKYPAIAERLSAAFDIISAFIGFLVRSLDNENTTFSMPPDLLLKLRKDLAETMSLTIEYLRDRWDASIAGASGLHPSARAGTSTTSEGTHLTLTWDSKTNKTNTDPLILACIRSLAIWIREDENENLRNETAGLMDMFMDLYGSSAKEGLDFRYPILTALEAVLATDEDGVVGFVEQDGWQIVFEDLRSILEDIKAQPIFHAAGTLNRGIEIVRTLLAILDHTSTVYPHEDWMTAITVTASMQAPPTTPKPHPLLIEFEIAMLQLATALLKKAPFGMQRRYLPSIAATRGVESQLEEIVKKMEDTSLAAEFMTELDDVRDLGFSGIP
ncbi:hypothetical protein PVAG01_09317 [Phlyctema vagabunda]|uniref:DUF1941 family protein n=1 Tax=Phlyctema vagabunda TaxID=108571 RepID=A0ABR4P729_9HELO